MNKRIVIAIKSALTQRENPDVLEFFIFPDKTEQFWKLCVIVKKEYEHLIPRIEGIGKSIGFFYGEGLNIRKENNYIIFE